MHYKLYRKLIAKLLELIFGGLQVAELLYFIVTFEMISEQ